MNERLRWCIRARDGDLELIVLAQVPFVGLSGALYRADFIVGAVSNGRVVWLDTEIDEPYHEQQKDKDAERDADVPVETIRIPEARLMSDTFMKDLLGLIRQRLGDSSLAGVSGNPPPPPRMRRPSSPKRGTLQCR